MAFGTISEKPIPFLGISGKDIVTHAATNGQLSTPDKMQS